MKFSKISSIAALSSVALAAPAMVTVTEHVHASPTVTVQGVIYFQDGAAVTSFTTIGAAADPTPVAAAAATAAAPAVANVNLVGNNVVDAQAATTQAQVQVQAVASTTEAAAPVQTTEAAAPVQTTEAAAPVQTTETSAAAAPAATTAQDNSNNSNLSDFANTILNAHNAKRALHQDTNSLSWSDDLASYAQNYANNYDCSGNLVHSGGAYGENLALGYSASGAVDVWYDEISGYDFSNPGYSPATGHFTQLVWKSSTQIGCGIKNCNNEWGNYVICSYNPAGNFIGEFAQNVGNLK
ncbi:hypothetical protein Kpol_1016p27 [Vanderwaltozyma polyspora DSM 70294]|uniref:SCP domain-containing protein n=1 Tax=Vanderwaltozyma polyspora (strain ATCC 22028 / DSM 70294 / BCRC 21397 / CBS 2163 / NBRC 10782 / NRRL Y-8283 / UCD 57-17) TaxID=436907 RepID=A7TNU1_VANPO|nr:uncharacterized protein Kpol_1016p27 [Vanderwaltozyma polyspora DSM 70294]EDO16084.1 hypothetical protein Kpol_1016p27 [Vanderwaltozyma polyspora DSM 70294]